jgi:uncharacterized protein DUF1259
MNASAQPSRRLVLAAGGAAALSAGLLGGSAGRAAAAAATGLPVDRMEEILQADGLVSGPVLEVDIDRSDLHVVGPQGVPFREGFQLQHEFFFQQLGSGQAIINGDMALLPAETQKVIDGLNRFGFVFQAFHQHLYDMTPMVWFIHLRKTGNPLDLARAVHELVLLTRTPLPQHSPAHPTTPLPADRLAEILGGDATVGPNGIVTVSVDRKSGVVLGGHRVDPGLGVSSSIQFQPMGSGDHAAAVPDFSMTADEVNPVIHTMRAAGWQIGCLYNQETDEHPQLYFSHAFKTGEATTLAQEIRRGLDHTDV